MKSPPVVFSPHKLRTAIERSKLSQTRLEAELISTGVTTKIRNYLNGTFTPSLEMAAAMAQVLGCRVEDMMERRR